MWGLFGKKREKEIGALTDEDLKKVDVIILVDHSGSMGTRSHRFPGNRLEEVQEDVYKTAEVAERFDSDGLTVIAFSSDVKVFDKVGSLKVASVFKAFPPDASTNLSGALTAAVTKALSSEKNAVVLVYTDGEPDDPDEVREIINRAATIVGRPKIGFTFIQVGDEPYAAAFLDDLDKHMTVDVCATVRAAEASKLTFQQLAWLAQNG